MFAVCSCYCSLKTCRWESVGPIIVGVLSILILVASLLINICDLVLEDGVTRISLNGTLGTLNSFSGSYNIINLCISKMIKFLYYF